MKRHLAKVQKENFEFFLITQIRAQEIDVLSKLVSSSFAHLTKNVLVEFVPCRSTEIVSINTITEREASWMNPIVDYLKDEKL